MRFRRSYPVTLRPGGWQEWKEHTPIRRPNYRAIAMIFGGLFGTCALCSGIVGALIVVNQQPVSAAPAPMDIQATLLAGAGGDAVMDVTPQITDLATSIPSATLVTQTPAPSPTPVSRVSATPSPTQTRSVTELPLSNVTTVPLMPTAISVPRIATQPPIIIREVVTQPPVIIREVVTQPAVIIQGPSVLVTQIVMVTATLTPTPTSTLTATPLPTMTPTATFTVTPTETPYVPTETQPLDQIPVATETTAAPPP